MVIIVLHHVIQLYAKCINYKCAYKCIIQYYNLYFNIEVKVVVTPIQFYYNLNNEINFNSFLFSNCYFLFLYVSFVFFLTDSDKCIKYFKNIYIIFLILTFGCMYIQVR